MITIVIACLNDTNELLQTVHSAVVTATQPIEIIIVDDCSSVPVEGKAMHFIYPGHIIRIHRNKHRLGVGPSRHIGACLATGDILFFVDSHCRFTPGWDDELRCHVSRAPNLLLCGSMIGFDASTPFEHGKPYFGATWNFCGHDQKRKPQVFECVWQPDTGEGHCYTIPAPMGACYGMMRDEYLRLGGLQYLRSWGCDEQVLSLKFWLCSGGVMLNKSLTIGHRFRTGKERVPFPISEVDRLYNKLFCIHTLLPEDRAQILISKIPGNMMKTNAMKELLKNWNIVEAERQHNIRLADGKLDERFTSFLERFGLGFPES